MLHGVGSVSRHWWELWEPVLATGPPGSIVTLREDLAGAGADFDMTMRRSDALFPGQSLIQVKNRALAEAST
jgi:hypothetical protein